MSKAILVMDMPTKCICCPLATTTENNNIICIIKNYQKKCCSVFANVMNNSKPNNCPLREVPQKKSEATATTSSYFKVLGYNACIDEIMKGVEENG